MIDNPYWLVLLVFIPLLYLFRRNRYYVKISSLSFLSVKKLNANRIFAYLTFIYLLLASLDLSITQDEMVYAQENRSYILINDGSASMISLTDSLVDANKSFLELLRHSSKPDTVGSVVFSDNAFIVSYPLDDVDFTKNKLERIVWSVPPLNLGTNIENALWISFLASIKDFSDFDKINLSELRNGMLGAGGQSNLTSIKEYKNALSEYLRGTCFILFTDGYFSPVPWRPLGMSTLKIVDMCQKLGIVVYVIDLEPIAAQLKSTGFLDSIKKTGGDVFYAKKDTLDQAYKKIFEIESAPRYTKQLLKQYLSTIFGYFALTYMAIFFIFYKTNTSI